jgi:uncharacterized membrane protein YgcG
MRINPIVAMTLGLFTCFGASIAQAQSDVGEMSAAERSVTGAFGGRARALTPGDGVVQNEVIRTGPASAARMVFLDNTNLAMGASSSVTLDRFVYDGAGTARSAVINATRGAFRWVSGASPSRAYQINTPLATIGVRGTTFDLQHQAGRTVVVLVQGAVRVCTSSGSDCAELTRSGQIVTVTARGVSDPRTAAPRDFDFESTCLSAGSSICNFGRTRVRNAPRPTYQPTVPQQGGSYNDPGNNGGGNQGGGGGQGSGGGGSGGGGQGGSSR